MAPMLDQAIRVRSQCHHCQAPVAVEVGPDGPSPGAEGVMVWVGKRTEAKRRIATSL
jgi:hypothetical protein